ncbi:MAG TPA: methyl-accepting chemotaxis protein [Ktedonobacteraceae bacterium]|nr:methyl-accepting chemotaxis protein [Ktedonobacteraceae bacterium]
MSEKRQQNWSVPLRVRFRSPAEQAQWEREHILGRDKSGPYGDSQTLPPPVAGAATVSSIDAQRPARQIKELLRLSNIMRADLGLSEVLQQVVASASVCAGFRILVVHLIEDESNLLSPFAFAGLSEENINILRAVRRPAEQIIRLMRPEFRIGQSYFISHEYIEDFEDIVSIINKKVGDYRTMEPGGWHPDDAVIVPVFSLRKKKLLGFLSLADPEDSRIPTIESIEVAELFANQAAIAIDNARIFEEKEAESQVLDKAMASLLGDVEQIQRGDLRVRIHSSHEKLQPIGEAINQMVEEFSDILGNVQMVTQAVDKHARDVQHSSDLLVRDANQQELQVQHISHAIDEIAGTMSQLSSSASELSRVVLEAVDVTLDGQSAVDRAVEGMSQVREATTLSARIMKRLGESGQEINETILAITDLTTRMNLVALNAAIEATRAGELGRGFVVIAQEIRTLAVNSSEAAKKVASHIRSIQRETSAISQSVEHNTLEAVKQTELVTQTGVAFDAISVVTEQMAALVQGICIAADNQAQSSHLVVSAVEQIAQMTSEITLHMRHMQQSLAQLVELTNTLRSRMAVFKVAER